MFGTSSAVAVAVIFLFLYLQTHGISRNISPTAPRDPASMKPDPSYDLPLRLADPDTNPEPSEDKAVLLQDFAASLRSISGMAKQKQ